jgi:hypothetical protein
MSEGLSPEEIAALLALPKGLMLTLESIAKRMTAPFWWIDPAPATNGRQIGGTICFVDTGERLLGITAAHIHRALIDGKQIDPDLACQIGAHTFQAEARLIDIDDNLDLATYEVSKVQISAANADLHHATMWPPVDLGGDKYFFSGWPWSLTILNDTRVKTSFLHFIVRISDRTDRKFVVQTHRESSVPWGLSALPPGTNLGGMSGGPFYRWNETGIDAPLTLVGIVTSIMDSGVGIATPLTFVNADGTIQKT